MSAILMDRWKEDWGREGRRDKYKCIEIIEIMAVFQR
jgi:hypothetical protein